MVLLESISLPLGSSAPLFSLKSVDEKTYNLEDYKGKKAVCIIFTCNHCPYAQAIWQRIIELKKKYIHDNIEFLAVNPNIHPDYDEDSFDNMKRYAKEIGINIPYLVDEDQSVAKSFQAQCTPDIYLYDKDLMLIYHGRLDDNWQNPNLVTKHDLDDAIHAHLQGNEIAKEQYPSMGCSIKWQEEEDY